MSKKLSNSVFEFKLKNPISYQTPEGMSETKVLILNAPSTENKKYVFKLQQNFLRALRSMSSMASGNKESKEESEITGQDVLSILLMSDIEFEVVADQFAKILPYVCKVDSDVKMTSTLVDRISIEDFQGLLGEYMANFIIPSWTKPANKI